MPVHVVNLDAPVSPEEITVPNVEAMSLLSPFGCKNPAPVFLLSGVTIQSVSAIGNGNHLRMSVTSGRYTVPLLYFGMTVGEFPFAVGDRVDVACTLGINDYNDQRTVTVRVVNLHPVGWKQGEILRAQAAFEAVMRGEETADGTEPLTRQELAVVFRYLRDHSPVTVGTDGLYYILRRKMEGYSYLKHLAALQIMREVGLLAEPEPEHFIIVNGDRKVDLQQSATFRKLQIG